jgi:hypothetical protein
MKLSDIPLHPTPRTLRQFATAWLVVFATMALHRWLVRGQVHLGYVLGALSLLGILGLLKPSALRWLFIAATIVAFPIGWIVSQLVLAVMFYLVLTPLALCFRLLRRDALQLRPGPERPSFWFKREEPADTARYLKQF